MQQLFNLYTIFDKSSVISNININRQDFAKYLVTKIVRNIKMFNLNLGSALILITICYICTEAIVKNEFDFQP